MLQIIERLIRVRFLVFAPAIALFVVCNLLFTHTDMIQIDNIVTLCLALAMAPKYLKALKIYLREAHEASIMWMSLGIFVLVATAIEGTTYSVYIRLFYPDFDLSNSFFVAMTKYQYAFGFGCFYLAGLAREQTMVIPPRGWISLFAIVGVSGSMAIAFNHIIRLSS